MLVCAKCATSEEFISVVMAKGKALTDSKCDICKKNAVVFKRV